MLDVRNVTSRGLSNSFIHFHKISYFEHSVPIFQGKYMYQSSFTIICYRLEQLITEILYGSKNGVRAFGYNSARRKWTSLDEIWSTVSTLLGAGPGSFGRDPRSGDSLRDSRGFVFVFGQVNNARFHRFSVGQILRRLNTITSIGEAVKTFETKTFYHKVSF